MASNGFWLLVFFPQYMLVYGLPPAYPISSTDTGVIHVNYFDFLGKMLVAFPASVVYAIFVAGIGVMAVHLYRRLTHDHAA